MINQPVCANELPMFVKSPCSSKARVRECLDVYHALESLMPPAVCYRALEKSPLAKFSLPRYPLGMELFRLRHSDQRTVAIVLAILAVLLCWHAMWGKQATFEPKQYQFRIDLNTATLGELQALPGIGPVLSESIIQYRDQNAPIYDFYDLLNVRGIGERRLSNMKPYFID